MKKLTLTLALLFLSVNYALSQTALAQSATQQTTSASRHIAEQSEQVQQQIISAMRDRWRGNFIPSADMNPRLLQAYAKSLSHSATRLWQSMDKQRRIQQLWPDSMLDNKTTAGQLKLGANLYTVYQRLFVLAKAWSTPATELYHDPALLTALTEILTQLNENYYNASSPEYGNWWHWELGISRKLNDTLVILYNHLPASLISNYNQATRHFVRDPRYLAEGSGAPYSTTKNVFTSTGGNRIDGAQVVFVRGLLENNPAEISAAVNAIPVVLDTVQSGDGFYADGSFIQHKDIPYTGTYGQVLLYGLGLIKNNVAGTPWDFSQQENARIYQVIRQTFLPWLYQGIMSDAVSGRSISRKNGQDRDVGASVINAIALFVNGATKQDKLFLQGSLKAQLTPLLINYYQAHLPENLAAWQVINDIQHDANLQPLTTAPGGKLFADMDRLLYRGDGYQTVVAMHSNRVGSYECINGENLRGQRTADGMTWLYLPLTEQYRNYWPLVDSQHLPGTTSAGKQGWCDEQYRVGQLGRVSSIWAGGVTLDQWASASMQLTVPASALTAKKSWFMAPNFMVLAGSDIVSDNPAASTIANRKISDNAQVMMGGKLLRVGEQVPVTGAITLIDQGNKIVWQPLTSQSAQVSIEKRSGNWEDIGTSTGKLTGNFLTVIQKNGKEYTNNYNWIVYPNQPAEKMTAPTLLENSAAVQAIQLEDKTIWANFWQPAKLAEIEALTPLTLILYPAANTIKVAVSSPQRDQRVSFKLADNISLKQDSEKRVTLRDGIISVDVSQLRGSSYPFELNVEKEDISYEKSHGK